MVALKNVLKNKILFMNNSNVVLTELGVIISSLEKKIPEHIFIDFDNWFRIGEHKLCLEFLVEFISEAREHMDLQFLKKEKEKIINLANIYELDDIYIKMLKKYL